MYAVVSMLELKRMFSSFIARANSFFFFVLFFNEIEFKKRPHQEDAAPMDLERPLHYRREEEIDQSKRWRRRCLCTRVLKVYRL